MIDELDGCDKEQTLLVGESEQEWTGQISMRTSVAVHGTVRSVFGMPCRGGTGGRER